MGYTKIAGMPVITGLYTILIPIAAFALFGSSKHLVVGADSATAAIMYAGIAALGISGLAAGLAAMGRARRPLAPCSPAACSSSRGSRGSASSPTSSRAPCWSASSPASASRSRSARSAACSASRTESSLSFFSGDLVKLLQDARAHRRRARGRRRSSRPRCSRSWSSSGAGSKVIPGGLVAVVGMIALSWIFDFAAHDISILGPVPSGPAAHRRAAGRDLARRRGAAAATAVSMFLVILAQSAATSRAYAVKYNERFDENTDLVGPRARQPHRRLHRHLRRQRQPDQDRDGRRGEEPHAGRAAHDRGRRGDRAALPHQAAAVPAERRALVGRLPDRRQADRRQGHARDLPAAPGRVLGRAA